MKKTLTKHIRPSCKFQNVLWQKNDNITFFVWRFITMLWTGLSKWPLYHWISWPWPRSIRIYQSGKDIDVQFLNLPHSRPYLSKIPTVHPLHDRSGILIPATTSHFQRTANMFRPLRSVANNWSAWNVCSIPIISEANCDTRSSSNKQTGQFPVREVYVL